MWTLVLVIGLPPAIIAHSKGRNFFVWYLYGTALFIAALPHSIVLKPLEPEFGRHGRDSEFLSSSGRKKCSDCAELIATEARVCRFCGWRGGTEVAQPNAHYVNPRYASASNQSNWRDSGWKLPDDPAAAERMRRLDRTLRWRGPGAVGLKPQGDEGPRSS